ncbi:MoaD/ThiS family protein [Nocardiopsis ansamitocini]|uniref:Thiamine biosynthesis protein ThiS n=1 Tax=Nocardiopsis ansamitocini TaxID=1670832 RepID=A0A9W6P8U0_9ACTN|nr:MoaD/ThiS family protein [Nocardiopsis ansamitocini]GLU49164.1 thiamine biosynthesis protein ThiS [Nocardiopsis ansamitocini]
MANGTMRYWAAAKDAAGTGEETLDADSLAEALDLVRGRRSGDHRFLEVLRRSSLLVNGVSVGKRPPAGVSLSNGWVVEVLPPFAGG